MNKPKALKKGDTIGLIAPSSPARDVKRIDKAIEAIKELGFKVKEGAALRKTYGFLAGKDDERLKDIHDMFEDKEVDGIFCLKGGYGTPRIANKIDAHIIRNNPKVFVGYSDITSLHIVFNQKADLITFHGPMPHSDFISADYDDFTRRRFLHAIMESGNWGEIVTPDGQELQTLVAGKATGQLVGGNLTLISRSMGTPYEIDTTGKILFIEDTGEEPYQIDGMLCQLRNAGKLDACAGFIIGDWNDALPHKTNPSLNIDEVVNDLIVATGKPVLSNLRAGHCNPNITLPLGAMVTMDATNKIITVNESCLS